MIIVLWLCCLSFLFGGSLGSAVEKDDVHRNVKINDSVVFIFFSAVWTSLTRLRDLSVWKKKKKKKKNRLHNLWSTVFIFGPLKILALTSYENATEFTVSFVSLFELKFLLYFCRFCFHAVKREIMDLKLYSSLINYR